MKKSHKILVWITIGLALALILFASFYIFTHPYSSGDKLIWTLFSIFTSCGIITMTVIEMDD